MMDNKLESLKKEYMNVPIPKKLDFEVKKALKENRANSISGDSNVKRIRIAAASIVAAFAVFTIGANTNSVFATTLLKVPIVGSIVKVLTFREYTINEDMYKADIKVPSIQGLKNQALGNSLNEKYIYENKKLYEDFMADMEKMKKNGGGNLGIKSGYTVKTDTDKILSVENFIFSTVNSLLKNGFVTIDKKNEVLITLPSLFKDDSYIDIISENVKKQMIEQNNSNSDRYYWIEDVVKDGGIAVFKKISKDQSFYISKDNKLVICFEKYEVAPGYMGNVEFVIPTDAISDVLIGNEYIK